MAHNLRIAFVSLALACSSSQAPPSASPTPTSPQVSQYTTDLRVDAESLPDTGVMGRLRADLRARLAAASRAVTIVVEPDTIRLNPGESLALSDLNTTALDSAGVQIKPFSPAIRVRDPLVATFRAGRIVALRPGNTDLILGAPATDSLSGRRTMRDITRLVIIVLSPQTPT